jgi:hypothetical protein
VAGQSYGKTCSDEQTLSGLKDIFAKQFDEDISNDLKNGAIATVNNSGNRASCLLEVNGDDGSLIEIDYDVIVSDDGDRTIVRLRNVSPPEVQQALQQRKALKQLNGVLNAIAEAGPHWLVIKSGQGQQRAVCLDVHGAQKNGDTLSFELLRSGEQCVGGIVTRVQFSCSSGQLM